MNQLAATARIDLPGGLAPGASTWHACDGDRLDARLIFRPQNKIEVDLWWNRSQVHPDVQLVFGLYGGAVEFGSLVGNGFDRPQLHQLGFGTLAVNIAVQALRACCDPATPVGGMLFNTDEEGLPAAERERLQAARRAFWRRFGLEVRTLGNPPMDHLAGRVGDLRLVETGLVAGRFPRCPLLGQFSPVAPVAP